MTKQEFKNAIWAFVITTIFMIISPSLVNLGIRLGQNVNLLECSVTQIKQT